MQKANYTVANRYEIGQTFIAICIWLCQNDLVKSNDSNNHLKPLLILNYYQDSGDFVLLGCFIDMDFF